MSLPSQPQHGRARTSLAFLSSLAILSSPWLLPTASAADSGPYRVAPPSEFVYSFVWAEIAPNEMIIDAVDLQHGTLYFQYKGHRLFYEPEADCKSSRITALAAVMNELRQAKQIVLSFSSQRNPPVTRWFPNHGPASLMKTGFAYSEVSAFFIRY